MADGDRIRELKRDTLGVVERVDDQTGAWIRRRACGNGWPGTGLLARWLLRRERRALVALRGVPGVPALAADDGALAVLTRRFVAGEPLWAAAALPRDFFDLLADLVRALHARGVCHNDLHKENNVLVGPDGRPALIDFQIATVHAHGGRTFARRCRDDLRHVEKHRLRYERQGRAMAGELPPRPLVARLWLRFGKRPWNRLRRLGGRVRHEPRRPKQGPWPDWTAPVGPRREGSGAVP